MEKMRPGNKTNGRYKAEKSDILNDVKACFQAGVVDIDKSYLLKQGTFRIPEVTKKKGR